MDVDFVECYTCVRRVSEDGPQYWGARHLKLGTCRDGHNKVLLRQVIDERAAHGNTKFPENGWSSKEAKLRAAAASSLSCWKLGRRYVPGGPFKGGASASRRWQLGSG